MPSKTKAKPKPETQVARIQMVPCPLCGGDVFSCGCVAAFTPGPWKAVSTACNHTAIVAESDPEGPIIGTVTRGGLLYDRVDSGAANQRLMLAAPAFALAWSMVPEAIRESVLNFARDEHGEWVEEAITKATT